MRLKSSYRPKPYKDGGAVPLHVEVDTPAARIESDKVTDHMLPVIDKPALSIDVDHSHTKDEASQAFQKQIDALRKSEDIQRQRHAAVASQHGLTPNQMRFLQENPSFPHHPEVAKRALMAAHAEGHADDSDLFHIAVGKHFTNEIGSIHSDVLADRHEPEPKPRHRKPKMDDDDEVSRGRFVSAPVSRGDSGGGSFGRGSGADRPGRVTLSAEEKDLCRRTGQSEVEYARGKIDMLQRKAEGSL
jgi:hypothetical protein